MTVIIRVQFFDDHYVGRDRSGNTERYPTALRLHSAFVNAAASGSQRVRGYAPPRSKKKGPAPLRVLDRPSDQSMAFLEWWEEHPFDLIHQPRVLAADKGYVGFFNRERYRSKWALDEVTMTNGVVLSGPVEFVWDSVPDAHLPVIESVFPEIPYVGESSSRALVSVNVVDEFSRRDGYFTLLHDKRASWATRNRIRVPSPDYGRARGLVSAYEKVHTSSSGVKDPKRSTSDNEVNCGPYSTGKPLALARQENIADVPYLMENPPTVTSVWDTVHVIPVKEEIPEEHRVEVCVRAHRALVRCAAVPIPLITGTGTHEANHLAVQLISRDVAPHLELPEGFSSALLVMVPSNTDENQEAVVSAAVTRMTSQTGVLYQGWERVVDGVPKVHLGSEVTCVRAGEFWPEPTGERTWLTYPLAVSEYSRGPAELAPLISLALVRRDDILDELPRRFSVPELVNSLLSDRRVIDTCLIGMSETGEGTLVRGVRKVEVSADPYTYKINNLTQVRLYQAAIKTPLVGDRELFALGQTRHLGGGLLVPLDFKDTK